MALRQLGRQLPVLAELVQRAPIAASLQPCCSRYCADKADPKPQAEQNNKVEKEEWTEVVHQETGQTYYWNQKTGASEHDCSCQAP